MRAKWTGDAYGIAIREMNLTNVRKGFIRRGKCKWKLYIL